MRQQPVSTAQGDEAVLLRELSLTNALHSWHLLKLSGSLVWCNHCGAYAQQRLKHSKLPCRGSHKASSLKGQPLRLRDGLHLIISGKR